MADAEKKGYAGVSFLFHHITKHVVVEWTGSVVNEEFKSYTEGMLVTLLKGKMQDW